MKNFYLHKNMVGKTKRNRKMLNLLFSSKDQLYFTCNMLVNIDQIYIIRTQKKTTKSQLCIAI